MGEDGCTLVFRGGSNLVEDWRLFCIKEKSIYAILNQCEGETTLRINVWVPADDEESTKINSMVYYLSISLRRVLSHVLVKYNSYSSTFIIITQRLVKLVIILKKK